MTEYKLSKTILTDGTPVRSLTHTPQSNNNNSTIISGSEGGILSTTILPTYSTTTLPQTKHSHQITAILALNDGGGYVTGCKDALIRLFSPSHTLIGTLHGHEKAVTSLSLLPLSSSSSEPLLISGSWDGTAKLWNVKTGTCIATMEGHENTVSVQGLPPPSLGDGDGRVMGRLVTGSAGVANGNIISGHKIRIWEVSTTENPTMAECRIVHTVADDHDGPIRGLTYDEETAMIYSCSNDGSVKIRDANTGSCVVTVRSSQSGALPPMLLDVVSLSGRIAACSEDGNVFLWDISSGRTDQVQILPHPDCVWTLYPLSNGDVMTGCNDGMIRIFTLDPERCAPKEEVEAYEEAVEAARAKSSSGPSKEEISKLTRWETAVNHPGTSEGQVQVFNKNDKAIAAQWSTASRTWIEVGEVTGRNDSTGTIDGVRYDHVFPIEVDVPGGGVQNLKIGYNEGENPFVTAQGFIDRYELDQGYLSQIADYIRQRVGQGSVPTLGMDNGNNAAGGGGGVNNPVPMQVEEPAATFEHLPMIGFKSFETGADSKTLTKVLSKIKEFSTSNEGVSPQDLETLEGLASTLSATNRYHASTISDDELKVLKTMIEKWPLENVFPALDLARLLVLHPDSSKPERKSYWDIIIKKSLHHCHSVLEKKVEGMPAIAVPMLTMRLCANCFKGGSGSTGAVRSNLAEVLICVKSFVSSDNKNVRLALSTVLLNVASYLKLTGKFTDVPPDVILPLIGSVIDSGKYETEATVRILVAFGTILLVDEGYRRRSKELGLSSVADTLAKRDGSKGGAVALEIQRILQ